MTETNEERKEVIGKLPNKEKKSLVSDIKGITYEKFWKLASKHGFKIGYEKEFNSLDTGLSFQPQKEQILYHEEKGLIIYTFFDKEKGLIRIHAYGEAILPESKLTEKQKDILLEKFFIGPQVSVEGETHWKFGTSETDELLVHLDEICKNFTICNPWSKGYIRPTLWFLTPSEEFMNVNIYEIINSKVEEANPVVRKIIYGQ